MAARCTCTSIYRWEQMHPRAVGSDMRLKSHGHSVPHGNASQER